MRDWGAYPSGHCFSGLPWGSPWGLPPGIALALCRIGIVMVGDLTDNQARLSAMMGFSDALNTISVKIIE